jgi:hypothetical protein
LKGAVTLLQDHRRSPRAIYIEVHPYAWPEVGTSSESLLRLLTRCNYRVLFPSWEEVKQIERYGEIIAYKTIDRTR